MELAWARQVAPCRGALSASAPGSGFDGSDPEAPPARRNFLIPALEVPAFVILVNLLDRLQGNTYAETHGFATFGEHLLHGPWQYDADNLRTNFFSHAYAGSLYFNFARSSGLSFWWSYGYSFLGSLLWELGGENSPPSKNDQVLTPIAGSIIGEALYRVFALTLREEWAPRFWRELAAFLVNPAAGFNRRLFHDRYQGPEFEERSWVFAMVTAGGGYAWMNRPDAHGGDLGSREGSLTLEFVHGRPADPAFRARQPFDHFRLTATLDSLDQGLRGTLVVRGLLGGWRVDGGAYRGVTGFFGDYWNFSSGIFRQASTGVGFGSTGELRLSEGVVLQTMLVLSVIPIGAADTTGGERTAAGGYHLGSGGQASLELRLHLGERAMFQLVSQQSVIGGVSSYPGIDAVVYSRFGAFVRVLGPHSVGLAVDFSGRSAKSPGLPDIHQQVLGATFNYVWTSSPAFGATGGRAP